MNNESYFDGTLLQQIGIAIVTFLLTLCTFGICLPWAICITINWETKHTVINGRRLRFDGTAMGLFWKWLKMLFFTIITLGIYSFWAWIAIKKWTVENTHFEDEIPMLQQ